MICWPVGGLRANIWIISIGKVIALMQIKEVTLPALRSSIGQSVTGDYCARYSTDVDPDIWTRSALEREAFANEKGFQARSHPWMDKGRPQLDVLMVSTAKT